MTNESQTPEQKGADLLAGFDPDSPALKFPVAPDVQSGDCVWLNGETGQYEKVTETSDFHGIFDGIAVIIPVSINDKETFLRHSLIDGQMTPGVWGLEDED